jgi:hypothetical protein
VAALDTLTSPAVLAFLLGVLAAVLRSDVRLPDAVHTAMSSYLLLAIGLKGGAGLRNAELAEVALPVLTAVLLGVVTPLLAWLGLRLLTRLGPVDRAAVSAHYGSTSLVTFTAALARLDAQGESYDDVRRDAAAVLEVPGILIGCCWPGRAAPGRRAGPSARCHRAQHRAADRRLAIGALSRRGYDASAAVRHAVPRVLVLSCSTSASWPARLRDVPPPARAWWSPPSSSRSSTARSAVWSAPAVGPVGGAAASACSRSHRQRVVHSPRRRRSGSARCPEANPAYYLTTSLGITFPFNLVIGIPLYLALARALGP